MKSFRDFYTEKALQNIFDEVAREAAFNGWTKQTYVQNFLDHYSTEDQDKFLKLVTLVENSTGASWGANIGNNIGGFVGGGLKGLAQGFRQGFGGGNGAAAQGQNQPQQQIYNAEAVPQLNPQQMSVAMELKQTMDATYQKLQQVGLKGYANYLSQLMTALKRDTASNVELMKRQANFQA